MNLVDSDVPLALGHPSDEGQPRGGQAWLVQKMLWKAETSHVLPPTSGRPTPFSHLPLLVAVELHMPWGQRPTEEGCIAAPWHSPEAKSAGANSGLTGGQNSINLHTAYPPGMAVFPQVTPAPAILFPPRQQLPGPWQL